MAQENFSIGVLYNITKNQNNPMKTVRRDRQLRKTLHTQTNKQTDRQTNRHYENNGHLTVNQKSLL